MDKKKVFDYINDNLDIPHEAYEKAIKRYESLGQYFGREDSELFEFEPKFRSQGSFRLGTAIKPIQNDSAYDLDITCILKKGVNKKTHTQEKFKKLIQDELEKYRKSKNIKEDIEIKQRCLRINYSGNINFHMDIVPSIPESDILKSEIKQRLIQESRLEEFLAEKVSKFTVAITDDESESFSAISDDWQISNPEGYALWFENRMKISQSLLQEKARSQFNLDIEDVPTYKWESPLQKVVKILKRHRDLIYFDKNDKEKPISIIITTLAALAYEGERSIESALKNLPKKMKNILVSNDYKLPNPVRHEEDFTDKWEKPIGKKLKLKDHFINWMNLVISDIDKLFSTQNHSELQGIVEGTFGIDFEIKEIEKIVGTPAILTSLSTQSLGRAQPRPWGK